jgi:nitroreductase
MERYATPTPWQVSPEDYDPAAPMPDRLKHLIRYAILAPSSHNTQPWLFHVGDEEIWLYADATRWLQVADPDQRELHISLGCALENLLIAAEFFGFGYEVRIPPEENKDGPAVVVRFGGESEPCGFRGPDLLDCIPRRRTNHSIYDAKKIPDEVRFALFACAVEEDVKLHLLFDDAVKRRVHDLVVEADARQFADPRWREELGYWIGQGAFGASWLMAKMGQLAVTYVNLGRSTARHDALVLMSAPAFGLITAEQDTVGSRIRVGQLFERLYLTAERYGLGIQPISQIVEDETARKQLTEIVPGGVPMQPFRMGYAEPEKNPTPRRPVEEVLI